MTIYQPAEDSYFFADFLKNYLVKAKVKTHLDMGTGSGILAETASHFLDKKDILCVDIDKESLDFVSKKGFKTINSDLFSNIPEKNKFDLITFNAPYLPQDSREPLDSQRATTGGINGDEVALEFVDQAKQHLTKKGKIFLLISSLTPMNKLKKFKPKIVKREKLWFEELKILEIKNNSRIKSFK